MALTFPLQTNEFWDLLRVRSCKLRLADQQEISGLASGEIIVADLAPKYWEADITLINMENADAGQVQSLVDTLDGGLNTFYMYDPRRKYPLLDPDGSIVGDADVTIMDMRNNKEIRLEGLPDQYPFSPGDFISFDFGSSPTHRAFHRIAVADTANNDGETGWMEVRPHILPGATNGTSVRIRKANFQAIIIPGSLDYGEDEKVTTRGMSFRVRQLI